MKEIFLNLFKKNYKEESEPKKKLYGKLSGIIGIGANVILCTSKLIIGLLSGSIAIMADALNNLSDTGASVISLVTLRLSMKPADKEHPFGHARIEYVSSLIISFLILLVGFEMISDAVSSFINGFNIPEFKLVTLIVLALAVVMKLILGLIQRKIGNVIDSSTLKASAIDSLLDSISTFAVLVSSIIIHYTDFYYLDAIVGLGVSALIMVAGIRILNETKNSILGEAPVDDTVSSITEILKDYEDILGTHDLIVHNYGPGHTIVSFHAEVDGKGDIFLLHDTIDNVEKRLNEELGIMCTIHLDPILKDDPITDKYKADLVNVISKIDSTISIHDFRVVVGTTHTNLIFDVAVTDEFPLSDRDMCEYIEREVKKISPTYNTVITVDRDYTTNRFVNIVL